MEAREKITLFLILIFFFFCIIFSQNQKANARRSLNSFSENDPLTQFNQTSSINITGVASTLDQATIDSYLNTNGDGLTWDVTEAPITLDPNSVYNSKEWNEKSIENSIKRLKELWQNTEFRKRQIEERLERWKNKEYKEKAVKKILKSMFKRPTSLEARFLDFIKRNNIPLSYCGDGSLLIDGKNPDFVDSNGRKICIEVANKFHHSENYAERRIEHFAKYGWKCLVVWEDELEDEQKLSEKIRVFMNGEN